jgi:hypothetical protein
VRVYKVVPGHEDPHQVYESMEVRKTARDEELRRIECIFHLMI